MADPRLPRFSKLLASVPVELHFLYMPFFGAPREPMNAAFYRGLGTLHLLPERVRDDLSLWADPTHFNPDGARVYTDWLIADVLKIKPKSP